MLNLDLLATWLSDLTLSLDIPFVVGPEEPEFGDGDKVAVVTLMPGGPGELREGMFEGHLVQILWRARQEDRLKLVNTAWETDQALKRVGNEELWGTYVTYVSRQSTLAQSFDEPERDRIIGNYIIETGS